MKVSVITVCFNSERTIERTIQSVLHQTYTDIEYIIVDGKSTDSTLEIISKYSILFEGRMKLISEKDNGIYDAMNKGIRMATGDLIGIVNSDDYYEKDAVEVMVRNAPDNKYFILYGFQRGLVDGKEKNVVLYNHNFLRDQMITHPTCFVSASVYKNISVFNTTYKSSADYEFVLKMKNDERVEFIPVYHIISNFSLGGMSSTLTGANETAEIKYKYGYLTKRKYVIRKILNTINFGIRSKIR
ncbi:glycosyltransferase family 2 protein [Faecalicatena orotica]|uniref:glycosyltransferase family 2 protein n=1 Tax=Faecalicatena orotica TaxID=1544 RepID=UPI0031DCC38B